MKQIRILLLGITLVITACSREKETLVTTVEDGSSIVAEEGSIVVSKDFATGHHQIATNLSSRNLTLYLTDTEPGQYQAAPWFSIEEGQFALVIEQCDDGSCEALQIPDAGTLTIEERKGRIKGKANLRLGDAGTQSQEVSLTFSVKP